VTKKVITAMQSMSALADPTRMAIVLRLFGGPRSVLELVEPLNISQPSVTKHLDALERAGLISRRTEGRKRICSIRPDAVRAIGEWVLTIESSWKTRLRSLEEALREASD
jgi:DNA-binding transcriptional ArsR family regulator